MSIFLFSSQLLLLPCFGSKEASGHDLDHHPLHHSQGPVERTSSLPQAYSLYCPWARHCHRASSAAGWIWMQKTTSWPFKTWQRQWASCFLQRELVQAISRVTVNWAQKEDDIQTFLRLSTQSHWTFKYLLWFGFAFIVSFVKILSVCSTAPYGLLMWSVGAALPCTWHSVPRDC